jgi:hypothetical protein
MIPQRIIPNRWTKSSEAEGHFEKNHTYCGLLIAVLRTIAHPVNQDIKHEAVTE